LNEVFEKIATEIQKRGRITFARFMEIALYCPVYGYYEKEADTIGRHGDYYTSASVGNLFGELLALRFADWIEHSPKSKVAQPVENVRIEPGEKLQIIEAGAHRGELAGDILKWMRTARPNLFEGLEYIIVEPSLRRREWQRRTLKEFAQQVRWVGSLSELGPKAQRRSETKPSAEVFRILFCNELLDAMPAHRLGWDARERKWFEWGVTFQGGRFVWTRMEPTDGQPETSPFNASRLQTPVVPTELLQVLPDGFTTESCPAAVDWWRQAAEVVRCGKLVAIDYGLTTEELFIPERQCGTLRAYHQHQLSSDLLTNPGQQDLTAHVNFSAIREAGEESGCATETFTSQEQFFSSIAASVFSGQTAFGPWTSAHTRQFRTLAHPELMGHAFKVLVQSREEKS
jgi:SAM-dependent MidA family methyltransferase